ncbi:MAG: thiamine diphosphokinase [Albidovulum sp.]|uniref:thiamine diphosphokinase n=1 Tax=Albidovulum sp. TaxID=1872424 RepID=UPI003CC4949F
MLQSDKPVTLLGAGQSTSYCLKEALTHAPFLVAADGGANMAIAAGYTPEAVIGDFDSITADTRAAIPPERLFHISEQDTTDFEKCLSRIEAPLILGVGFAGGRLDHVLAVWTVLARYPAQRCLILGEEDVVFLAPQRLNLDLAEGTRVSLFPMGPVRGRSDGLFWPIDGIGFAPDGRIGTSNRATGPVTLDFDAARMLVLLPRSCLEASIAALVPGDAA